AQKQEETKALEKEMLAEVDRKPLPEDKKEAERKEVKQLIADALANELRDLPRTAQELIAREQGIRPDTSPAALLGHFFTAVPSASPQNAGILPALVGSLYMALITILVAVPLGVGAAVYLEEYRGKCVLNRLIQLNISNLAGVPSVVYGILGAFVFVDLIFRPIHLADHRIEMRNALGGGLTLALLTLPVVIISAQEALRAVPTSIRHAALALGATRWQVVKHHVLPNALSGILTGTILAVSRTLGEAAPLVLFGSLLYVQEVPGPFSSFTVMPMQVFKWMDEAETGWKYNAAMGSLVLMLVLLTLNATAIYLRQRFQKSRW
ncbi:MAG: phosphate ABC transporter permease PstA, partial [Acidobacteria bacterium]|nr:phosphate ABC transporter permease PstA [Acidobacteriota bacterium]